MSYFYEVHCNSKIDIDKKEFGFLFLEGFINFRGQIAKSRLEEAEKYLHECGCNVFFAELRDRNKFDKLSNIVELVPDFNSDSNSNSRIYVDKRCFNLLLKKRIINNKGQILKSRLKEAEECLQESGWNGTFVELRDKDKFDKLSDVIEFLTS